MTLLFVRMNVLAEKRKEVLQTINSLSADIKKEQDDDGSRKSPIGFVQRIDHKLILQGAEIGV